MRFSFFFADFFFGWVINLSSFLGLGRCLFLYGYRATSRAFSSSRVSMRALTAYGQSPPMTQSTVRSDFHETLDIERGFLPQVSFNRLLLFDDFPDLIYFIIIQIAHFGVLINTGARENDF